MIDPAALEARLIGVRERIAGAAGRAGRDPSSVTLVAVSKTFPAEDIDVAASLGLTEFGENKVQEAERKVTALVRPLRWHLVGHLQSNKARRAGAMFDCIHSIDEAGLLPALDESARDAGRTIDLLVQVDLSGERTKHGAQPQDVPAILTAAAGCAALRLRGLMLLPPFFDDPDKARPFFARLRELRDRLVDEGMPPATLAHLSMGMSHDFEVAIEEGATMIRVGTALFGSRPPR